jgi:RimJ/RimL family protein N-acetyltransferase
MSTMVTKVEVENTPSRRAVEKAGFREAGIMRFRRRPWRSAVGLQLEDETVRFLDRLSTAWVGP